ncbi:MAG: putative glycoside hydrolase [Patescibacteria group bacterium]
MSQITIKTWQGLFIIICLSVAIIRLWAGFYFDNFETVSTTNWLKFNPKQILLTKNIDTPIDNEIKIEKSLATPTIVKGIYLTGYTFSNKTRRNELADLIQQTELNSMVIDTKDPNGNFTFSFSDPPLASIPLSKVAMDDETYSNILNELQAKNIYTIARITTFQDDILARSLPEESLKNKSGSIWQNWKGLAWLDMTNPKAWEIPVLQAKKAASLGFDEIQFDYIRFPSDGDTNQIAFTNLPDNKYKYEILNDFFIYLKKELADIKIPISIDLFGLTYQIREDKNYDLNIGQRLVDSALYFDYISPMVYPSHYPTGYLGYKNPAEYPFEVVNKAMKDGNQIIASIPNTKAKTRPWLQDFNMGAIYDASMVRAQIKAVEDNGGSGWLLWNPRNVYTSKALKLKDTF